MPSYDWLCRKLGKLNITLVEGYPSGSSEAGGLFKDQFVLPEKSQNKWYGLYSNQKADSTAVSPWNIEASIQKSTYLRIAKQASITSNPPQSRLISQESLRKWEKSAREASVICNQAAGFNQCLFKVQQNMQTLLKAIRTESKDKSASKVATTTDKLPCLMDFNASISQAMAKTIEHLSDFFFVSMANLTLISRDSYLSQLKSGIKPNTAALRTAPLQLSALFRTMSLKERKRILQVITSNVQVLPTRRVATTLTNV